MKFSYEDKIRGTDLEFDYKYNLVRITIERIKNNPELMDKIKELVIDDYVETTGNKPSYTDFVELKIDELATDAVDGIRIYTEFDIEVKEDF